MAQKYISQEDFKKKVDDAARKREATKKPASFTDKVFEKVLKLKAKIRSALTF